jgi:hypothetical protein
MAELIITAYTYDQGRIVLNNAFSGSAQFNLLSATTLFSGSTDIGTILGGPGGYLFSSSTGSTSVISNSGNGNIAGPYSFALGKKVRNFAGYSVIFGGYGHGISPAASYGSVIGGSYNSITGGIHSFIGGGSVNSLSGNNSSIVCGTQNVILGAYSCIHTGKYNSITERYSSIHAGTHNTITGRASSIVGGTGNTISGRNSVILGGGAINSSLNDTAVMSHAYVDVFLDLNPQSSYPIGVKGRVFFSGGTLNKLLVFNGTTWETIQSI